MEDRFEGQLTHSGVDAASDEGMRDKARRFAHDTRIKATDATRSKLSTQKSRASESLGLIAESLRSSGDRLNERNEDNVGKLFNSAADQIQRFAGTLERRDVNEIVNEVETFARRQPALFLGGAFALGLIGARFLKSSGRDSDVNRGMRTDGGSVHAYGVVPDREVPTPPVVDSPPADANVRSTTTGGISGLGT